MQASSPGPVTSLFLEIGLIPRDMCPLHMIMQPRSQGLFPLFLKAERDPGNEVDDHGQLAREMKTPTSFPALLGICSIYSDENRISIENTLSSSKPWVALSFLFTLNIEALETRLRKRKPFQMVAEETVDHADQVFPLILCITCTKVYLIFFRFL